MRWIFLKLLRAHAYQIVHIKCLPVNIWRSEQKLSLLKETLLRHLMRDVVNAVDHMRFRKGIHDAWCGDNT